MTDEDPYPFEVLEILGEGAFGAVCIARMKNDPLERQVAIKVLKQEYAKNPKVLHRTRDEARLLSRLHHPNIVTVEQLIEIEGRPILVMELVRGPDLKTLLRRHGAGLPPSVAMECVRQTCVALHIAYNEAVGDDGRALRVIHRDIKPSNMLLSVHGQLKVVDFGIATGRFSGRESKTDSVVMGSRPYMAPERLDRGNDTPAVDIYGAGMSLYELLTGNTMPLSVNPSSHDRSLTEHLLRLELPGMTALVNEDLRQLVRRMCAYDVDLRPTARDAANELGRLIDAVDPAHRLSLEEFAKQAVEPLYQDRKKVPLRVAVGRLEDKELLTGALGSERPAGLPQAEADPRTRSPRPRPRGRRTEFARQPMIFLGAIFGMVTGVGAIAANKATSAQDRAAARAAASDRTQVRVWFPSDVGARLGTHALTTPGPVPVSSGVQDLELFLDDGRTLTCKFEARPGMTVRYVVERGSGGISIDDGPVFPCLVSYDPR
ncbi:MAG: serine/threonine protein kinase [Alphaproteobacteria bacterium]|nr:serine/threonine protein kinase [Alphaproteobacteria bacterium]